MVILIGLICKKVMGYKFDITWQKLDTLTVGLAKGGSIALLVYFLVKVVDVGLKGAV